MVTYVLTKSPSTVWLQKPRRDPALLLLLLFRSANESDQTPLIAGDVNDLDKVTPAHTHGALLLSLVVC